MSLDCVCPSRLDTFFDDGGATAYPRYEFSFKRLSLVSNISGSPLEPLKGKARTACTTILGTIFDVWEL